MWRQVDIEDYVKAKKLGIEVPTIRKNHKKNLLKKNKEYNNDKTKF